MLWKALERAGRFQEHGTGGQEQLLPKLLCGVDFLGVAAKCWDISLGLCRDLQTAARGPEVVGEGSWLGGELCGPAGVSLKVETG